MSEEVTRIINGFSSILESENNKRKEDISQVKENSSQTINKGLSDIKKNMEQYHQSFNLKTDPNQNTLVENQTIIYKSQQDVQNLITKEMKESSAKEISEVKKVMEENNKKQNQNDENLSNGELTINSNLHSLERDIHNTFNKMDQVGFDMSSKLDNINSLTSAPTFKIFNYCFFIVLVNYFGHPVVIVNLFSLTYEIFNVFIQIFISFNVNKKMLIIINFLCSD